MNNIKITELTNIGNNIAFSSLIPVVDMAGTPTTKKANLQLVGNLILSGAGGANFPPATRAITAQTVTNAAQPNITSVGTLTSLAVTGNITATILNVSTTANLGAVGNVRITGGTNGQVLTTNGTGGLSWTTVSGSGSSISNGNSNVNIATANGNVTISANGAVSTFDTSGTFTSPGNVNILGTRLNVGPGAAEAPISTNPTVVVTDSGLEFIQSALINENPNGSSDFAAYGADSDEGQGFADLGFAGHSFNDPNYSITPPGDGYVFVQGYANGIGGQLVLATGQNGDDPDIVFATGGFTTGAEFGRIDHSNNVLYLTRSGSGIKFSDGTIQTTAADSLTGNITFDQSNISTNEANATIQITSNGTGGINLQSNSSVWVFANNGSLTTPGNLYVEGAKITLGPDSDIIAQELLNSLLVVSSNAEAFIQGALINISDVGSADWVAHGSNGNDEGGYVDLGFNSAEFDDPEYTITGGGDGYVFVQGYTVGQVANIGGGNLVLATGVEGTTKDIVFATGGFLANNEFARIDHANDVFHLTRTGSGIQFADGSIQTTAGGSGSTGNVTFDDVTVQGDDTALNLSAGPDFTANLAYLQVRAGDVASHIHFDTGNSEAYDLIVGNDQKFVQVSSTGNIIMSSYDGNTSYTWTLDATGNLILAGGESVIQSVANSSLDPINPNVSTMILTPSVGYSSQSLVLDPTLPGHIHLRAPGANIDEPYANIFLGGEESSFEVGYHNGNVPNVFIHSGGNTWTFDTAGNLTFPRDAAGNTDPILTIAGGATPRILSADVSLAGPANLEITALNTIFTGVSGDAIKIYPDDGEISSTANLQIWANSGGNTEYSWTFDTTGNLTTPSNLVIGPGPGSGSSIFQYNEGLQILGEGANSVVQMGWTANTSAPGSVTTIAMNYPGGGEGNVLIAVGNNATTVNYWLFDNTGNLRLPGNTFAVNYANGTQVSLGGSSSNISNGNSNVSIATANGNVTIAAVGNTTMTVTGTGANVTGTLTSTGKIGYASGSTVTQTTNRGNGVTINALAGTIITTSAIMVANQIDTFSVANDKVDPNNDIVLVQIVSPNFGVYNCIAQPSATISVSLTGFYVNIVNISGFTTTSDAITIRFMVIKAPNA